MNKKSPKTIGYGLLVNFGEQVRLLVFEITLDEKNIVQKYKKYSDKVTPSCIASVKSFREFLNTLNPSKLTHYNLLDETFVSIYNKFRDMLYSSGFVNGNPEETKKSPDAVFLWLCTVKLIALNIQVFLIL